MQKITSAEQLKQSIRELEKRTKLQEMAIKDGLKSTGESIKESIKPGNLLKAGINSIRHTPGMKTVAINTFVGLAAGFLTRRFIIGKSTSILKRTLGAAIQAGITKLVYNKFPMLKNKRLNGVPRSHQLR